MARDLSPEEIEAYRLADNQTHELSDWDLERLPLELAERARLAQLPQLSRQTVRKSLISKARSGKVGTTLG